LLPRNWLGRRFEYPGPVYLRFTRDPVPIIYDDEDEFVIGKGKQLFTGNHVSLMAIGDMVTVAMEARDRLVERGVEAEVIDLHT